MHAPPVQDASGAQRGADLPLMWHDAASGSVHLLGRLAGAAEALGLDLTTFKGEMLQRVMGDGMQGVAAAVFCSTPGGRDGGKATHRGSAQL